jgi:hypothetical protein
VVRPAFPFVVAVVAMLLVLAGCTTPTMTPAQQEARELRDYCMRVTTQDMERCGVFFGGSGR